MHNLCFMLAERQLPFAMLTVGSSGVVGIHISMEAEVRCYCDRNDDDIEDILPCGNHSVDVHCETRRCFRVPCTPETAWSIVSEFLGNSDLVHLAVFGQGAGAGRRCLCSRRRQEEMAQNEDA
jgi:hypothetical protein